MASTITQEEQILDAKVDRIIGAIKRVFLGVFITALVVLVLVLVLEIKREFQIDIFQGINFTIDDWYFDKVGSMKLF
jgi:cell division protein FtsL